MKKLTLLFSFILLSTLNTPNTIGFCDIKGYVNNPGVYEVKENYTIQDIISLAGGLKNEAYTNNINLSKKVTDEMVIYIFSENEIDNIKEINNCICTPTYKYTECDTKTTTPTTSITIPTTTTTKQIPPTTNTSTTTQTTTSSLTTSTSTTTKITTTTQTKININTCTIEELISIKGLGEVKANNIIEYRNNNGPFTNIEDILKVDGIGESTFEKIKEFIEI